MKHADEEVTCPIITEPQPGNFHFEMRCEDCDIRFRLATATLGEVEDLYRQGRITQDEFEGYCLAWDLLSPSRDAARVVISAFPAVRRIARKLMRVKGIGVPAVLVEDGVPKPAAAYLLDEPAVAYDPEDPNAPIGGA
jgi:hypothetical protein